jgi:3-(methylthio)propanoyl-CoA dehydrogenase
MRSHIEAMRGLTFMNAKALDMSRHHPDADERGRAQELADLLVPLSKAWCTDLGVELTSMAVQIFGGMGFVEETGVAQHYRDARIAPIYEGTNGIQALDLIGRKLSMRGGAVVLDLLDDIEATDARLGAAVGEVRSATNWILGHAAAPIESMAGATPYLRALATTVGGWMLARQAHAAVGDDAYSEAKRSTATFYFDNILPTVSGMCAQAMAGSHTLMAVPAEALRSH